MAYTERDRDSEPTAKPDKSSSPDISSKKEKESRDSGLIPDFAAEICVAGSASTMNPGLTKIKKELKLCKAFGQEGVKLGSSTGVEANINVGPGKCGPLVGSAYVKLDFQAPQQNPSPAVAVVPEGSESVTVGFQEGYVKVEVTPQGDVKSVEFGLREGCAGFPIEFSRSAGAGLNIDTGAQPRKDKSVPIRPAP